MAEFCPECWNALNGTKEQADNWLLSEDLELCEGCGKWTHVIVKEKKRFPFSALFKNGGTSAE